ncbi:Self-incompatibility protein [Trema orientale]|uniref:Self-incompatibility protein n=1 Tax=Trema orientale TaxID=63057 RepID=A0A2P5FUA9_TREOI|nr:Self-incompatibility protein [Trema orientale]
MVNNNIVVRADINVVRREVRVRVINRLGYGQSMILHCQSSLDDIGSVVVEDGREMEWIISGNEVVGIPLFHCDMKPSGSSDWYSFNAYDQERDHARCRSECRWMFPNNGALFGYDQRFARWVWFPLRLT